MNLKRGLFLRMRIRYFQWIIIAVVVGAIVIQYLIVANASGGKP